MASIAATGFELQEPYTLPPSGTMLQNYPEGTVPGAGSGTGNWSVETTIVRSGAASRGFPDGTLTFSMWGIQSADQALGTQYRSRAWFYPTSSFTNTRDIMAFARGADLVPTVKVQWNGSTQKLGLFYGGSYGTGTQVGSWSDALTLNAWHLIEFDALVDAGASDTCALRVHGDLVASGTGLSMNDNPLDGFWLGVISTSGTAGAPVCYFDDVNAGTADLSAVTHTRIIALPATTDVQVGKWLAGAGGTTNLKNALNNAPAAGLNSASKTNTSQIKSDALDSNVDGPTETYQARMRSYTAAGIPGGHMVVVTQAYVCSGEDVAGGTKTFTVETISNPASVYGALACTAGYDAGACGTYPTNWGWDVENPTPGPVSVATGPTVEIASTTASNALIDICSLFVVAYVDDRETTYQHARTTRRTHRSPRLRR